MPDHLHDHYRAVLDDLRGRKKSIQEELQRIDTLIQGISLQLGLTTGPDAAGNEIKANVTPVYDYGKMSVRWGVLAHLSEGISGRAKTAQIAQALRDGGYQSGGLSFSNIVSGVLSTMKTRHEVDGSSEDGYALTPTGIAAWEHIKNSPKFGLQQKPE